MWPYNPIHHTVWSITTHTCRIVCAHYISGVSPYDEASLLVNMNSWIQFPLRTSHRTKQLFLPKIRLHLERQCGAAKSTYHIGNWLAFHNNTLYKQYSQRLTTQLSHTCKTVVTSTSLHRTQASPAGYTAFHRLKWHHYRLTNIDLTLNQCVTVGGRVTQRAPPPLSNVWEGVSTQLPTRAPKKIEVYRGHHVFYDTYTRFTDVLTVTPDSFHCQKSNLITVLTRNKFFSRKSWIFSNFFQWMYVQWIWFPVRISLPWDYLCTYNEFSRLRCLPLKLPHLD